MLNINPLSISFILITLSTWSMVYLVLKKSGKNPYATFWGYTSLSVSIWGLGGTIATVTLNKNIAYVGWIIAHIGTIFIPIVFFHFILIYHNLKKQLLLKFVYALGIFYLVINIFFNDLFFGGVKFAFNQFYYTNWSSQRGLIYVIMYVTLYWILLFYSFFILVKNFGAANSSQKREIKYLIASSIIGWLGAHGNFLTIFKDGIYPYSNYLIAIFPIIFTYGVMKYQLFNIKLIIRTSLIYSVTLTMITIAFSLSILIFEKLSRTFWGYNSFLTSLFAAVLIALLFTPIKNFIQRVFDKLILNGSPSEIAEENKQLRFELLNKEKFKAISTLSSSIAHDIKSPLTAIKTYFEYFPQKKNDPKFLEDFQRIVGSEISRINDLTNNLLEFAKPSPLQLQPTNINALLEKSLTLLHHQLVQNNINVVRHLDSTDSIQADPNKLTQAFLKLIVNAIEAMPNGGIITISTKSNKDQIEIEIQDSGIGIPEKDFKDIFKPFFTQKEKGTGLGLAIVEEIIKNHNGAIKVKSVQGKGTTFRLVFKTHINL